MLPVKGRCFEMWSRKKKNTNMYKIIVSDCFGNSLTVDINPNSDVGTLKSKFVECMRRFRSRLKPIKYDGKIYLHDRHTLPIVTIGYNSDELSKPKKFEIEDRLYLELDCKKEEIERTICLYHGCMKLENDRMKLSYYKIRNNAQIFQIVPSSRKGRAHAIKNHILYCRVDDIIGKNVKLKIILQQQITDKKQNREMLMRERLITQLRSLNNATLQKRMSVSHNETTIIKIRHA
jgi:hypothetical protein